MRVKASSLATSGWISGARIAAVQTGDAAAKLRLQRLAPVQCADVGAGENRMPAHDAAEYARIEILRGDGDRIHVDFRRLAGRDRRKRQRVPHLAKQPIEVDILNLRALPRQLRKPGLERCRDLGLHLGEQPAARHADPQALEPDFGQRFGCSPGEHRVGGGAGRHVDAHWADAVQRIGQGERAGSRHSRAGRLEPDDAVERRRSQCPASAA